MTYVNKFPAWMNVSNHLREAIISHRLTPGMRLAEDELCTIYGHGRSIIRSALKTLTQEGLLTHIPNRGVHVSQPSRKEAMDVFESRLLVEPHIARLASSRASPEEIARLRQHLGHEKTATDSHHSSDAISLSAGFHITIADIADNSFLSEVVTDLVSRSSLIVALYWRKTKIICDHSAHEDLVGAIEAGDGDAAEQLMRVHIEEICAGLDLEDTPEADTKPLSMILAGGGTG